MAQQRDFYEILGVGRTASIAEIESAYDRLVQDIESGKEGLEANERDHRLGLLNQAYWALSDKTRRASYDASLNAPNAPLRLAVELRDGSRTSPRKILNILGRLIVMGLLIQIGFMFVSFYITRQANSDSSPSDQAKYDAMHGKLSQEDRAAAEALAEKQRQDAEAEQIRREREDAKRRQEWELEQNRRYAQHVSDDLQAAEERARQKAAEERQRLEYLEKEKEERERERVDRLREKWRPGSTNKQPDTDDQG